MKREPLSRRLLVKSSVLGLLAASVPNVLYAKKIFPAMDDTGPFNSIPHDRYPAIPLEIAWEVVGSSHFKFDRLKELVDPRPELAKAIWDWGYGDWEQAIGAASHVGRKDIIEYLVSKGAVPTIFTYAVLGEYAIVKTLIESTPGIQKCFGPHGISLLQHAKTALEVTGVSKSKAQQLINYLQTLGDADGQQHKSMEETQKTKYVGDYRYGDGKEDGFTIKLNMMKMLSLGKLGKTGGTLLPVGEHKFTYRGAPSVIIEFLVQNDQVVSLTLTEPGLTLTAKKI